jgi:aspartyl protease family protein
MQRRTFAAAGLIGLSADLVLAQDVKDAQGGSRAAAPQPQVQLAGIMGQRALLVIDGQSQMLAVGSSARGITLLSLQDGIAQIQSAAGRVSLRVGGSPAVLGFAPRPAAASREVVLTAGPGGHFISGGAINGQAVSFLVDTGATLVAMSQSEAARIGVDLRTGERGLSGTANGTVPVVMVTLSSVRLGEVEISNVRAVVMPAQMPHVLLGNSFLTRFQMRRENDVMRLELRP